MFNTSPNRASKTTRRTSGYLRETTSLSQIRTSHAGLSALIAAKPDLDLITLKSFDKSLLDGVDLKGADASETMAMLRAHQRLARAGVEADAQAELIAQGLDSAYAIANMAEMDFRERSKGALDGDTASLIHHRARSIQSRTIQAWHSLRQHSSPALRSNKFLAEDTQVVTSLADLPSYQDLFGSLDYLEVPECRSVTGAPAYFTDLMRVTYESITTKNTIAPEYQLKTRREDLYTMELTCTNTDTPLPKVDVVNAVLAKGLVPALGPDIDYAIATRVFPYRLPANLPLIELRAVLNAASVPLSTVYYVFRQQTGGSATLPVPLTIAGEGMGLSCEQRAIVTTSVTDPATLGLYFGMAGAASIALAIPLGNVSVTEKQMTVSGSGFQASGIQVNWLIQVGSYLRVVTAITDTQLTVDCAWPTTQSGVAAFGYAPQSIVQKNVFAQTVVLGIPEVGGLIYQNLNATERGANLQSNFFINSAGGASIGTLSDTTDVNYTLSVLTNLTDANIDRTNRFLRLASACGWTWEELDWAIRAGGSDINNDTIVYLAQVASLAKRLSLGIIDTTSLYAVLKTYGRGETALRPQDPYDRIYNATKLATGQLPYRPTYSGNPLFDSEVIDWIVPARSDEDRSIQAWLKGALGVSDNDLCALAPLVGTTENGSTTTHLTVEALSSLHAYALLAQSLKWKVTQLIQAMGLLGLAQIDSMADVVSVVEFKTWLDQSGLDLDGLTYVVTGGLSRDVSNKLNPAQIPPFINSLHVLSKTWLLTPASFIYDDIAADRAAVLFATLVALALIDAQGIALVPLPRTQDSFEKVAPAFPILPDDLVSDVVTPQEATDAYDLLVQHGVIKDTFLTEPVDDQTDLSYLFPGEPTKTDSVRDVLVTVTDYIWHTARIVSDALYQQDLGTYTQLGLLMQDSTEMARVLVPPQFGTKNALEQLLSESTPIEELATAIIMADRLAYAADAFGLDALNMAPAVVEPSLIGVNSVTDPTLADIEALSLYAQTLNALDTNGVALTIYLALPADQLTTKMVALQAITGWPAAQSETLVKALWGSNTGYNTTAGLMTMRTCFMLATGLALDIASALALAKLASTPMLPLPTIPGGETSGWALYRAEAQAGVNAYHGRYLESAWAEAYRPIHDIVAGERRQDLVDLAVLIIGGDIEGIDSPATLSEYYLIDVETGTCNDTTPMVEATQAVQMYIQRCRLALEPGVTKVEIPQIYWSWLNSFRLWQANREIYIYPESYIDPALRRGGTPLYDDFVAELTQDEITKDTVTAAYTNYINKFTALAALVMVDSVHARIQDALSGEMVDQLIVIGRTATKPYTYYWRTLRDEVIWSPWLKIDASITVETATPIYAFGRLFMFWVESETTQSSQVSANAQTYSATTRAKVNYSFRQLDGTWTAPQTATESEIDKFMPADYDTNTIKSTSKTSSLEGIDLKMPYWHKPYVVLVPGRDGATDSLFVTFGNAYKIVTGTVGKPTGTNLVDLGAFNEAIYADSTLSANAATALTPNGNSGSVMFPGAAIIDADLHVSPAFAFLANATKTQFTTFGASVFEDQFVIFPSQSVLIDDSLANASDYPARVNAAPQAYFLLNLASIAKVLPTKNIPGWYIFNNGDEAFLAVTTDTTLYEISEISSMTLDQFAASTTDGGVVPTVSVACGNYSNSQPAIPLLVVQFTRLTTGAGGRLSQKLFTGGVDALLSIDTQKDSGPGSLCFCRFFFNDPVILDSCEATELANPDYTPPNVIPPDQLCGGKIDFAGSYGEYYWEIYFFIPFLIASMLRGNQRFEEAKTWFEYIFNPTAGTDGKGATSETYWQYLPFRDVKLPSLTDILTDNAAIAYWNLNPYDPFAVADLRLSAYQKTIVMHYVENLLDWGDFLFQQETREAINEALLVYLLAGDLLGPRPKAREAAPEPAPQNFQNFLDNSAGGHVPVFLIELESALPSTKPSTLDYEPAPYNTVNAYFGVGEDRKFMGYWTRLEDRLYKLRNCMDINGTVRTLPFYAPPIDPGQLVKAAASGSGGLVVVEYGQAVLPNYRFPTMVERAKSLTGTLIQFGQELLSALEKQDGEYMALLRTQQERTIAILTASVKQQQITDAQETLASLGVTLQSATYRRDYYQALIDVGLLPAEIVSITMMAIANIMQTVSGALKAAGGAAHLIPNAGSPFAMTYGGVQIGSAFDSLGAWYEVISRNFDFASNLSSVLAGYQRREQDWQLQEKLAAFEILQVEDQIQAAQARVEAAQRDFAVSQEQINQADKVERVLTTKFTNQELYNWMATRLATIYFQTYQLAFDLAMAAQRAYQFELDTNQTFLDFGYWDSRKKGLLAGEGLMLGLAQMEKAYLAGNSRRLMIEKTISLRNINPQALLKLQGTGTCSFELTELLFDQDYPGHYSRKIERVAVTIPAVVSPYQNLNGTLLQTGNVVVMAPDIDAVKFLLEEDAPLPVNNALRFDWRANQQIALSRGVNDTGIGPVEGGDDRYVPFEGTGAVSGWRLELPMASNRIDYNTISDVVITLTYSALPGGTAFADEVAKVLPSNYAGAKLVNLAQEFSSSWYAFMHPGSGAKTQSLVFKVPRGFFPANLDGVVINGALFEWILKDVTFVGPLKATLDVDGEDDDLDFAKIPVASVALPDVAADGAIDWTITVNSDDIPVELQDANGMLDPAKVVGLNAIFTYAGELPAYMVQLPTRLRGRRHRV
jgi:hypothetical protein